MARAELAAMEEEAKRARSKRGGRGRRTNTSRGVEAAYLNIETTSRLLLGCSTVRTLRSETSRRR